MRVAVLISSLVIWVMAISSIGYAYSGDDPEGKEIQLTTDTSTDRILRIWGDLFLCSKDTMVYVLNYSSGEEKLLKITDIKYINSIGIYGNNIVYSLFEEGPKNLYLFDYKKNITTILYSQMTQMSRIEIYGDLIIWLNQISYKVDGKINYIDNIWGYDLENNSAFEILNTTSSHDSLSIYGHKIVYNSEVPTIDSSSNEIFLYDMDTGTETRITKNDTWSKYYPCIYRDKVVYSSNVNWKNNIYLYDMETKKEINITFSGLAFLPKIFENKIIYTITNFTTTDEDIYYYDLNTGIEYKISTNKGKKSGHEIYGDIIAWSDGHDHAAENWDIYLWLFDRDGDGIGDSKDWAPDDPTEWADTDRDGYGDNRDKFPTDQNDWNDTDSDGWGDNRDRFPDDPNDWNDTDNDGYGDNRDIFPENATEWNDNDSDGYGDNSDLFPDDPTEWNDTDGDGWGDNRDKFPDNASEWNDIDDDGWGDNSDMFPDDPLEWVDNDGDTYGDNRDLFPIDPTDWNDTDGDGYGDHRDKFPGNPTEWNDTDGDGYGDNGDRFPSDPNEWKDTDGDRYGDNSDKFPSNMNEWNDTDGDGVGDNSDKFPTDPAASIDSDSDGYTDSWNSGKSQKDSTTGLKIDAYPNDPKKFEKEESSGSIIVIIMIAGILVIILIVGVVVFLMMRKKKNPTEPEDLPKEDPILPTPAEEGAKAETPTPAPTDSEFTQSPPIIENPLPIDNIEQNNAVDDPLTS